MRIVSYLLAMVLVTFSLTAEEMVAFSAPDGWRTADANELPKSVKLMIVGASTSNFPPSLNLAMEQYAGSLKDYLKNVKQINVAKGLSWKSLGTLQTQAGTASISQVDAPSEWGDIRLMHVMLKHGDTIYILTGGALKAEFAQFYPDFFKAFKSLRFEQNANGS